MRIFTALPKKLIGARPGKRCRLFELRCAWLPILGWSAVSHRHYPSDPFYREKCVRLPGFFFVVTILPPQQSVEIFCH